MDWYWKSHFKLLKLLYSRQTNNEQVTCMHFKPYPIGYAYLKFSVPSAFFQKSAHFCNTQLLNNSQIPSKFSSIFQKFSNFHFSSSLLYYYKSSLVSYVSPSLQVRPSGLTRHWMAFQKSAAIDELSFGRENVALSAEKQSFNRPFCLFLPLC